MAFARERRKGRRRKGHQGRRPKQLNDLLHVLWKPLEYHFNFVAKLIILLYPRDLLVFTDQYLLK